MFITTEESRFCSSKYTTDSYAWEVIIDFGRPGLRHAITMRDIIHWTAYRLDTGDQGYIINHRAAVLLRQIAEQHYPYSEDTADYIIEELQDAGSSVNVEFAEPLVSKVDLRLLDLRDGYISIEDTFGEVMWTGDERTAVLVSNEEHTIDFNFPAHVVEQSGVLGLRICALDLVHWLCSGLALVEKAYTTPEDWLDELERVGRDVREARHLRSAERIKLRRKDAMLECSGDTAVRSVPSESDAQRILEELSLMI